MLIMKRREWKEEDEKNEKEKEGRVAYANEAEI